PADGQHPPAVRGVVQAVDLPHALQLDDPHGWALDRFSPKGWEYSAQGNALGLRQPRSTQPERLGDSRSPSGCGGIPFPPQGVARSARSPWAEYSQPFGLTFDAALAGRVRLKSPPSPVHQEVADVAVLHDVLLAFGSHLAGG